MVSAFAKLPKGLVLLMMCCVCALMIVHVFRDIATDRRLDRASVKPSYLWRGERSAGPINPRVTAQAAVDYRQASKIVINVKREAFGPFGPFGPSDGSGQDHSQSGFFPTGSFPMPTGFPESQFSPRPTVATQTITKATTAQEDVTATVTDTRTDVSSPTAVPPSTNHGSSTNSEPGTSVIASPSKSAYSSPSPSPAPQPTNSPSPTPSAGPGSSSSSVTSSSGLSFPTPAPNTPGPAGPSSLPSRSSHTSFPAGAIAAAALVGILFFLAILTVLVKLRRRRAAAAATRAELASTPFNLEDAEAGVSRQPSPPHWKSRDQLPPPAVPPVIVDAASLSHGARAARANSFPNEKQSTLDSPTESELYDTIERRLTAADVWASRQTRLIQENAALRAAVRELEMEARRASRVRSELPPDYENVESSESNHDASPSSISS